METEVASYNLEEQSPVEKADNTQNLTILNEEVMSEMNASPDPEINRLSDPNR